MPCASSHLRRSLRNIPFCLARRICTIVEEENTKFKQLSERRTLNQQKYPIVLSR